MTKEEAISRLKKGESFIEIYDPVWDEALKVAISALSENKTQMVDKSNFDTDQYKADLQSAFESGYYKGKIDGIKECTAKLERMKEELANG